MPGSLKRYNMNFISELQKTPKWREFEQWYLYTFHPYGNIPLFGWYCGGDPKPGFNDMSFDFQKGVFEKYLLDQGYHLCTERRLNGNGLVLIPVLYRIPEENALSGWCLINDTCDSFQELLIWYFNQ